MLQDLERFVENFGRFDWEAEQLKIIEENKYRLERLQAVQWSNSSDKEGKEVRLRDNELFGFGYSPVTIRLKKKYGVGLGRVTDHVTLFQTGALYREIFATITRVEFKLSSRVPYFTGLMLRTGDVTGLNLEMRTKFAEQIVLPSILRVYSEKVR